MFINDKVLYNACEICVADAGKEDDKLVERLYEYFSKSEIWSFEMIDDMIAKWDKESHVQYIETVTLDLISISAVLGPENQLIPLGSSSCSLSTFDNEWYFNRLFVNEKYRGQHIGSCLLDKMLARVKEKDIVLRMDINPYGNMTYEQLEKFYIRHGFKKQMLEGFETYYYNKKD